MQLMQIIHSHNRSTMTMYSYISLRHTPSVNHDLDFFPVVHTLANLLPAHNFFAVYNVQKPMISVHLYDE